MTFLSKELAKMQHIQKHIQKMIEEWPKELGKLEVQESWPPENHGMIIYVIFKD